MIGNFIPPKPALREATRERLVSWLTSQLARHPDWDHFHLSLDVVTYGGKVTYWPDDSAWRYSEPMQCTYTDWRGFTAKSI